MDLFEVGFNEFWAQACSFCPGTTGLEYFFPSLHLQDGHAVVLLVLADFTGQVHAGFKQLNDLLVNGVHLQAKGIEVGGIRWLGMHVSDG